MSAAGDTVVLEADKPIAPLWNARLDWRCRDVPVALQVLAAEPVSLPAPEPTEPAEGAIARLAQAIAGTGALILLRNPAQAFGPGRMSFAEGARLLAIASPEDEACWDEALSLGRPSYGVRGRLACEVLSARPASVLSALAYGLFVCEQGLALSRLLEDRSHVEWDCGQADASASVVIRGGFEAAVIPGAQGAWQDRGTEIYVRVVVRAGSGACWTQPRFIAPRRA